MNSLRSRHPRLSGGRILFGLTLVALLGASAATFAPVAAATPTTCAAGGDEGGMTSFPATGTDASFLAAHQEEGRDLAGAETKLTDAQIALIIVSAFAGLLLLILIL